MRKASKARSRALRQQDVRHRKRRRLLCLLLGLALAAGGFWLLRRLPFTLTEISRAVRQSFSAAQQPAPPAAPPALRGTIYDRNMEELAVSYQLHTLRAHPAELPVRQEAARQLALAVGAEAEDFQRRLESRETTVELIIGIDAAQAQAAESLELPGVSCQPVEVRYYPGHAAAGRLLGFVSEGTGLSGVEALYDPLLQPGAFRPAETGEINFAGAPHLGPQAADILLSLDLRLQKRLEEVLEQWRRQKGAASGAAVVLDPDTGRLLAAVRQPGLDPNYFWQTSGQALPKEDGPLFPDELLPELLRPLLAETAAADEGGLSGQQLPAGISAPGGGPSDEDIARCWHEFGFDQPAPELLPVAPKSSLSEASGRLSVMDVAVGAASLFNSGKRISPWLLKAVHAPDQQRLFSRDLSRAAPQRLIPPAAGVQLRRQLLHSSAWSSADGFLFVNSMAAAERRSGLSEQRLQDILIAAVPQDLPRVLLVMAVDYGSLYPQPPDIDPAQDKARLEELGRGLLPLLAKFANEDRLLPAPPPARNEANLRRFLLSRKLNRPVAEEKNFDPAAADIMPSLVGLSLRQGLQKLNLRNIRVQIRGSGMIVEQKPAPGTALAKIETCELTLAPFPRHEKPAPAAAKPAVRTQSKNPARSSGQGGAPNKP